MSSSSPRTRRDSSRATGPPVAQARGPRPDPVLGVFETLLVLDGRPVELEAHLARLDATMRAVFGAPSPPTARRLVLDHARDADLARLRLAVTPDDHGALVAEVRVASVDASLVLPTWDRGVELAPVVVAGGLGAHKWADRRLLAGAEADVAPCVPLLLDGDGAVLEASRGNVFIVSDRVLVTPPADGRLLPGVTRRRVLRLAETLGIPVREEAVSIERLTDAAEVFLTGAVRGIEPVRACDGAVVGSEQRMTPALNASKLSLLAPALSRELQCYWAREATADAHSRPAFSDARSPDPVPRRGGALHAQGD